MKSPYQLPDLSKLVGNHYPATCHLPTHSNGSCRCVFVEGSLISSRDFVFIPPSIFSRQPRPSSSRSNLLYSTVFCPSKARAAKHNAVPTMADGFTSKAQPSISRGLGVSQVNGAPPPSTLAAQLVDTISPSTKSSRSDENSELKGLFATIQKVKDDPTILSSSAERLGHNHMLIYVYSRVVLESIKLDDPFLDRNHVRTEALKAINFMRFTIKETPAVISYSSSDHGLLFRGVEPLWVWLLPQLLRMLGHTYCQDLTGLIEGFLQYLLLVVARTGATWEVSSPLSLYLRASLSGMSLPWLAGISSSHHSQEFLINSTIWMPVLETTWP